MVKREPSPSSVPPSTASSSSKRVKQKPPSSTDVKPKVEQDVKPKIEQDVKPKVEQDVKPSLAIVKEIPFDWLKYTSPEDLQKLLLQGCSSSPSFNALVSSSIDKLAPLIAGQGRVQDFKERVAEITVEMRSWSDGENWSEIVSDVHSIKVSKKSPLLSKLSALEALTEVITLIEDETDSQHVEFMPGESPRSLWKLILDVLNTMTTKERRHSINAKLVRALDGHVRTKTSRATYGADGREGMWATRIWIRTKQTMTMRTTTIRRDG